MSREVQGDGQDQDIQCGLVEKFHASLIVLEPQGRHAEVQVPQGVNELTFDASEARVHWCGGKTTRVMQFRNLISPKTAPPLGGEELVDQIAGRAIDHVCASPRASGIILFTSTRECRGKISFLEAQTLPYPVPKSISKARRLVSGLKKPIARLLEKPTLTVSAGPSVGDIDTTMVYQALARVLGRTLPGRPGSGMLVTVAELASTGAKEAIRDLLSLSDVPEWHTSASKIKGLIRTHGISPANHYFHSVPIAREEDIKDLLHLVNRRKKVSESGTMNTTTVISVMIRHDSGGTDAQHGELDKRWDPTSGSVLMLVDTPGLTESEQEPLKGSLSVWGETLGYFAHSGRYLGNSFLPGIMDSLNNPVHEIVAACTLAIPRKRFATVIEHLGGIRSSKEDKDFRDASQTNGVPLFRTYSNRRRSLERATSGSVRGASRPSSAASMVSTYPTIRRPRSVPALTVTRTVSENVMGRKMPSPKRSHFESAVKYHRILPGDLVVDSSPPLDTLATAATAMSADQSPTVSLEGKTNGKETQMNQSTTVVEVHAPQREAHSDHIPASPAADEADTIRQVRSVTFDLFNHSAAVPSPLHTDDDASESESAPEGGIINTLHAGRTPPAAARKAPPPTLPADEDNGLAVFIHAEQPEDKPSTSAPTTTRASRDRARPRLTEEQELQSILEMRAVADWN